MQAINNIPKDYYYTRYLSKIYSLYSVKNLPAKLNIDSRLRRLLNLINKASNRKALKGNDVNLSHQFCNPLFNPKEVYVAFSGGKDCLANAIRAKKEGYMVTLVYIQGINKSLFSEKKHAREVAKASGFGYKEITISITGKKEWNEHPLKNILILSLLVDEGLKNGVGKYALGNLFEENSNKGSIDYDFSDSYDLIKLFEMFVRRAYPSVRFMTYIHDNTQSFYECYKFDKEIINKLCTCITPDFRRPMIRKFNIQKFGEGVLNKDGCGTCYKCASEYLNKVLVNMAPFNLNYHKKCIGAIKDFDKNYVDDDVEPENGISCNQWGGDNTEKIQVLHDRIGFYIGRLRYDREFSIWVVQDFFGNKHYKDRRYAELVKNRFVEFYKLS